MVCSVRHECFAALGCRVWAFGLRVQDLGFRAQGLGCRVWALKGLGIIDWVLPTPTISQSKVYLKVEDYVEYVPV